VVIQKENQQSPSAMIALGLGTNVGDRFSNLHQALRLLCEAQVLDCDYLLSTIVETQALLPEGAPASWDTPYLNAVVKGVTRLTVSELLSTVKALELELGRNPSERWAPRLIDIDILLYGDVTIDSPKLTVPHKEICCRPFVAVPLAEVWPNYVLEAHGVKLTVSELASTMLDDDSLLARYALDGTRMPPFYGSVQNEGLHEHASVA
jgi:2-amino-4-hydroxy-6-hydroxymethyldihydropteridine diphosphokinase